MPSVEESFGAPAAPRKPRKPRKSPYRGANYVVNLIERNQAVENLEKNEGIHVAVNSPRVARQVNRAYSPPVSPNSTVDNPTAYQRRVSSYVPRAHTEPRTTRLTSSMLAPRSNTSTTTESTSPVTGRHRPWGLSTPVDADENFGSFSSAGDFGSRVHPITGRLSTHTGLDMSAEMGAPIYAPRKGTIESAQLAGAYGNQIVMRHGPQLETMYGHLSKYNVEPGQHVKRGDVIGYAGATGLATGPHLHWETWRNGTPVDPRSPGLWNPKAPRRAPAIRPSTTQPTATGKSSRNVPTEGGLFEFLKRSVAEGKHPLNSRPDIPLIQDPRFRAFVQGIAEQETGNDGPEDYSQRGVPTHLGQAMGKYQIMPTNIAGQGTGWDYEALGRDVSEQQYMSNPDIQDQVAMYKLLQYYKQYGPEGAAQAWYGGPGSVGSTSNQGYYQGPSVPGYGSSVMNHMNRYLQR